MAASGLSIRSLRSLLTATLLVALAGCASAPEAAAPVLPAERSASVGMEIVPPPPGASRMQLPDTQRFIFPNLIAPVVMPVYPAALLSARLPSVVVCVEGDIDATGRVMAARARMDAGCASGPVREEFVRAAVDAVKQWTFDPALLCVAPDTSAEDPCLHPQVVERPTQVRLTYAFRFSQIEGRPHVERMGSQ